MSESSHDRDPFEVVADAFLVRFRSGERPSIEEYAALHPELGQEIRELLPALMMVEQDLSLDVPGSTPSGETHRELGDFRILREIGRGGMGVVYEAVQQSLGRHVALKVLPWSSAGSGAHLERFKLEARAVARLHLTNIVPVFGVGEDEGTHYFAMQFIRGQGLDDIIAELRRLRGDPVPHDNPGWTRGDTEAGRTLALTVAAGLLTGRFSRNADPFAEPDSSVATAVRARALAAGV